MRTRSSRSNRSSRSMVAGLMVGVLVLSGSAAVGEENSTDPPVESHRIGHLSGGAD